MHVFHRLLQSVNLNSVQATNKLKQQIHKTAVEDNKKASLADLIRKNKILTFAFIFLTTKVILSFLPPHIARPEILARNRLEKKP